MKNTPLVSIRILTYNSSKYILDALNGAKNQTYKNIELIVSDDCSKDNTVEICRKWLDANRSRFVNVHLLTSNHNTGISANGNRAFAVCKGQWIKGCAGDDRLMPNCISDFVDFISLHPEAKIIFSKVVGFGDKEAAKKWPFKDVSRVFNQLTQEEIRIALCISNFLPAPSCFINTQTFKELGGYNEDIPLQEDWAFWMKATNSGIKLHFMNKETVEYRFSAESISHGALSIKYKESDLKAKEIGLHYLQKYFGAKLWLYTVKKCETGSRVWRFIHFVNFFNPFYHKYNKGQKVIYPSNN